MNDEQKKNAMTLVLTMLLMFGMGYFLAWVTISEDKWKCEADMPDYVECIWSSPPSYTKPGNEI